jgi:crotonobetainyl-CoA:carnitine CoA-transferase CaiB-like acyl-CoA transferase
MAKPSGPLAGYRVVEFCSTLAGPLATMLMADQGADVIKVETETGDQGRMVGNQREGVPGVSTLFINANRNKRSVVLNLKNARDLETAMVLAATADVVVQNYRPGVMERLGLGYDVLKRLRQDIIYISISGLGESGKSRRRKVYDIVVQGIAGFTAIQADRETGEPRTVQNAVTDKISSLVVWQAATAALLHRERTGAGQYVTVNMLNAALAFLWPESMNATTLIGAGIKPSGSLAGVRYVFPTADGHVLVGFVSNDEFESCCRALDLTQLPGDPRFSGIAERFANAKELNKIIAERLFTRHTKEWLQRLEKEDAVFASVNWPEDLVDDPDVAGSGSLREFNHPVYGSYRQPIHPVEFAASPASYRLHAPLLGEHTVEIVSELSKSGERR